MTELSSYVFSALRRGDFTLYRGSGDGLEPILLVAAEETSPELLKRLEHEHELKAELDADWAARPVALSRHDGRMALVLEDPGGEPLDQLLGRPMDVYCSSCASRSRSRPRSARCMSAASSTRTSSRPTSWWTRQAAASG